MSLLSKLKEATWLYFRLMNLKQGLHHIAPGGSCRLNCLYVTPPKLAYNASKTFQKCKFCFWSVYCWVQNSAPRKNFLWMARSGLILISSETFPTYRVIFDVLSLDCIHQSCWLVNRNKWSQILSTVLNQQFFQCGPWSWASFSDIYFKANTSELILHSLD